MLNDLLSVWFPQCCWNCTQPLAKSQKWLCISCSAKLPKTYFEQEENNALKVMLRQYLPLESAYAPFYFVQHSPIQALIHALKYEGKEQVSDWVAQQSEQLIPKEHPVLQCDGVVPVPLHRSRQRKRGYNQVTGFGQYWANRLGVPYLDQLLLRKNQTKTLVQMSREARWEEVKNAFSTQPKKIYKHLLLVDDVITTGATLTACRSALLNEACDKISVMGMAYAKNILP